MNINIRGDDVAVLVTNHGDEILYSCEKPVAGFKKHLGHFKTSRFISDLTDGHVSEYLKDVQNVLIMSDEAIELMFL